MSEKFKFVLQAYKCILKCIGHVSEEFCDHWRGYFPKATTKYPPPQFQIGPIIHRGVARGAWGGFSQGLRASSL